MSTVRKPPVDPSLKLERALWKSGATRVIGIDEVGRGCLAGPVYAAGVIFPPDVPVRQLKGIRDSKALSAKRREEMAARIRELAAVVVVGSATVEEIDRLNIRAATILAMQRVLSSAGDIEHALIDGSPLKEIGAVPCTFVVKGDATSYSIAAASIIAKQERSAYMAELHASFPMYGWDRNDGYGSATHRAAIAEHGITPYHRRSFGSLDQLSLF